MKKKMPLSRQAFQAKLAGWWPALKGSLSQVRKPCIRPNCAACASGKKHLAYLLSFAQQGRRRCMYVPHALAPLIRRALRNGRTIEQLLCKMGPALLHQHRRKRTFVARKPLKAAKLGPSARKPRPKS
jgi:hypothetical protein